MQERNIIVALTAVVSIGCAPYEGSYAPDCIAYEGNRIDLNDGRFVWEKFSDQVFVNDDGEVVNQFPGYPMTGTYRIDGKSIHMESDTGAPVQSMYLHQRDKRHYLLTAEQSAELEKSGNYAECALILGVNSAN